MDTLRLAGTQRDTDDARMRHPKLNAGISRADLIRLAKRKKPFPPKKDFLVSRIIRVQFSVVEECAAG